MIYIIYSMLKSIKFSKMQLLGEPNEQKSVELLDEAIEIPCDLILKSVG